MPGTDAEFINFASSRDTLPVRWSDGTVVTERDQNTLLAMRAYFIRRMGRNGKASRVAFRLLRTLLSPEQKRQLNTLKFFYVRGSSGNTYRITPSIGTTERVTVNGSRRFTIERYCLHDEHEGKMPPADLVVAHLLLIVADEPAFLSMANARNTRDQLWNGEYLRRVRNRTAD